MDRTITVEPSSTWSIRSRSLRKSKYSSCPGRILQSCLAWGKVSFDLRYNLERTWVSYDATLSCTESRSSAFPVTSVYQGVVIRSHRINGNRPTFRNQKTLSTSSMKILKCNRWSGDTKADLSFGSPGEARWRIFNDSISWYCSNLRGSAGIFLWRAWNDCLDSERL
jgi:hypothetical protein